MVLLDQTISKLYSKLENHKNHHHHLHHQDQANHEHAQSQELLASLNAFRSQVSKFIGQLALDLKPAGSETLLSLTWTEKCFGLLPFTNNAFAKLVVDIDHPLSAWDADSIEGYLSYTVCLLDLFNSISSSLYHLGQARLSLSHGLSLLEQDSPPMKAATKHMKEIQPCSFSNLNAKFGEELSSKGDKGRTFHGKEWVIDEAVKEMKSIGFWVCGILLSGLCSSCEPYMELKKIWVGLDGSLILTLDPKISEDLLEKVPVLKEMKEINDAVAKILDAADSDVEKDDAAKELHTKLHAFEKLCDLLKAEVDDLFNKVMTQRTELIDCFRLKEQPQKSVA